MNSATDNNDLELASDFDNGLVGRKAIARLASRTRRLRGNSVWQDAPLESLMSIAKNFGIREIRQESLGTQSGGLVVEVDGLSLILNRNHGRSRQLFTIAHEIAHTMFYDMGHEPPIRRVALPDDEEEERRCDLFAGELLAPKRRFITEARNSMSADLLTWSQDLARAFSLSTTAAIVRLQELKLGRFHPMGASQILLSLGESKPSRMVEGPRILPSLADQRLYVRSYVADDRCIRLPTRVADIGLRVDASKLIPGTAFRSRERLQLWTKLSRRNAFDGYVVNAELSWRITRRGSVLVLVQLPAAVAYWKKAQSPRTTKEDGPLLEAMERSA